MPGMIAQGAARHAGGGREMGAHAPAHEGADARPDACRHGQPAAQNVVADHPALHAQDGGLPQRVDLSQ